MVRERNGAFRQGEKTPREAKKDRKRRWLSGGDKGPPSSGKTSLGKEEERHSKQKKSTPTVRKEKRKKLTVSRGNLRRRR